MRWKRRRRLRQQKKLGIPREGRLSPETEHLKASLAARGKAHFAKAQ